MDGFAVGRCDLFHRQRILRTAIVDGTRIQMRSILLTSGTTIAGLLPLLYKKDLAEGKDIPVVYKARLKEDGWYVYDVVIQ